MNLEDVLTKEHFTSTNMCSWWEHLNEEFSRPYIDHLRKFLRLERTANKDLEDPNLVIYPKSSMIFAALRETPLCNVKVVIVGQDPSHNGQADGLAFSMLSRENFDNSSLKKIFEATNYDLKIEIPLCGTVHSLQFWANQGVLLLNSVLTVRSGYPKSHYCHGWERFTDRIIEVVSQKRKNIVFLLWGEKAKKKKEIIDTKRHEILCAPHPASRGEVSRKNFKEAKHFSKTNDYLKEKELPEIKWEIST